MSLIAQIFGKLLTPKNVLTWMPKSSSFKTPSCSQRVHRSQTLLKSARRHFYPNLPLIQDELSWKTYLWIRSKMLGLFLNTSTADHMYSAHSWEKIRQKFKRNYLKNQKQFLKVLLPFWKSTWNFAHLEKKDHLDRSNILEVIDYEKFAYLNTKRLFSQNTPMESTCSRVPNTAEMSTSSLLS